jgi:hypothetical protein
MACPQHTTSTSWLATTQQSKSKATRTHPKHHKPRTRPPASGKNFAPPVLSGVCWSSSGVTGSMHTVLSCAHQPSTNGVPLPNHDPWAALCPTHPGMCSTHAGRVVPGCPRQACCNSTHMACSPPCKHQALHPTMLTCKDTHHAYDAIATWDVNPVGGGRPQHGLCGWRQI